MHNNRFRWKRISSRQNAIVKRFRDLARTPSRSARGDDALHDGRSAEVLLDGEHLVQEAIACDIPIEIAVFSDRQLENVQSPIARIARNVEERGGRVLAVGDQILAAMSPVQHPSGVVAIARARPADVRVVMSTRSDLPLVLVLASLQDPGNVGAIVRTAAAFGASGVDRPRRHRQSRSAGRRCAAPWVGRFVCRSPRAEHCPTSSARRRNSTSG